MGPNAESVGFCPGNYLATRLDAEAVGWQLAVKLSTIHARLGVWRLTD